MQKIHKITLILGDGTGPELAMATKEVLDATGVQFDWQIHEAGEPAMEKNNGNPLPDSLLDSVRETKVALKAPIGTPVGKGFRSVNVQLRKELNTFANIRPAKIYPGVKSHFKDLDLVVIRENIEDLYVGIEFKQGDPKTLDFIDYIIKETGQDILKDSGISIKPISITRSRDIVEFAFDYARKNGRKKITAVHKANILKETDGLFLQVAREVAEKNSDIEFEDRIVDNMCMQLVQKPELYDVLVCPNLYGDIISDLTSGLVGGLGVAPGANIGKEYAVFEAIHGNAPKYAGLNKVNPTALILSGVLMLRHLNEIEAADKLEKAVAAVIAEGKDVTYDLKQDRNDPSAVGTKEMAQAIIKRLGINS